VKHLLLDLASLFRIFIFLLFYIFMTTIHTNITLTQQNLETFSWPITIDTSGVVIRFDSHLIFEDNDHYFIIGSNNVNIDGCGNTVDISGVSEYPGLVRNGTSETNGYSNTTIQNLGIISVGSTTLNGSNGWIGQSYYGANASGNIIQNCYSTGDIANGQGGIVGSSAVQNNFEYTGLKTVYGNLLVNKCYSTGRIGDGTGDGGEGGIFGQFCSFCSTIECFSTGNIIGSRAGGIFGWHFANYNGSVASSLNCYSTGDIIGIGAGGIFGQSQSGGTYYATNCYSRGIISGEKAGGIFGQHGDYSNLVGHNCYSSGVISGENASGILGYLFNTNEVVQPINCYIANGIWSSINASAALLDVGTTWNNTKTPYTLIVFDPLINMVCFKEGSKILTDTGYRPVENLRKGDLVKTHIHGYKSIDMIAKKMVLHVKSEERIKDQLYKCSQEKYPELTEDLVITGCHCVLVDNFASKEERDKTIEVNGDTYITDDKYRLPACADSRTTVYENAGSHMIYHFALENDNYYENYGVYANGLLVETTSRRYLKELSDMTLIE
jgi:hypothetical protein